MSAGRERASPAAGGAWLLGLVVLATALAWLAYRSVFALPHLGWDTWPMIATARIESGADFAGTFTEKLMDGRYPLGDFYRPMTNLSVALDHALWGTDPFGYHVTDFAILVGSAVLTGLFVQRLFASRAAAVLAALVFVLHPVHWESLPVTARRADTLSVFFVLLWCVALPRPKESSEARRAWLPALGVFVTALAAVAAKETGALVVALTAAAWIFPPGGVARRRLVPATIATLAAVGLFVAARTAVLGGLGGHGESSIASGFRDGPGLIDEFGALLLVPQPWFGDPASDAWLVVGVAVALVVAWGIGLTGRAPARSGSTGPGLRLAGLGFLCVWLAAVLVLTGMSGELRSWYSIPFLPIFCGFVGAGLAGAVGCAARSRALATVAAGLALAAACVPLRFSGLWQDYPEWRQIGSALNAFFAQAQASLATANPGQAVQVPVPPAFLSAGPERVGVKAASGIEDYGVQAWVDVVHPDRSIRVHHARRGPTRQSPGEILLVLVPGLRR